MNYSTMLASLLLVMNVPFFFRTVAYTSPTEYDHIYIVTKSGIVLDPVPGQRQDGTDTRENRPAQANYNQEVLYRFKKDYPMPALTILQGTRSNHKDKNGYPMGFARSRFLRQSKTMGCGSGCSSCQGCQNKPLGTWLSSVGKFFKDVVVESVISPINVTALQVTGSNLINYKPATQIGVDYTKAQNFAGYLINDSIKVGIQSPITAINTVTGANIQTNFQYKTDISSTFAKDEKKAQYLFVNTIGSLFGVKAYDSSKPPQVNTSALSKSLTSIAPTSTAQTPGISTAGFGTVGIALLGLVALGSMTTKKRAKKR